MKSGANKTLSAAVTAAAAAVTAAAADVTAATANKTLSVVVTMVEVVANAANEGGGGGGGGLSTHRRVLSLRAIYVIGRGSGRERGLSYHRVESFSTFTFESVILGLLFEKLAF